MRKLQEILSHVVRLFIGPHGEDQPVHSWGTMLLFISLVVAIFVMASVVG